MKTGKRILAVLLAVISVMSILMTVNISSFALAAPTWTMKSVTGITQTNARISSRATFKQKITCTGGGFYIGTSSSNLKKNAYPDKCNFKSTYIDSGFTMSKYHETLKAGKTYYYKIYVIANGTTFYSPVKSFRTSPAHTTHTSSFSFKDYGATNITTNSAQIYATFNLQKISADGFYIGTSSSNLTKVSKNNSGKADSAANCEKIFFNINSSGTGWFGSLKANTLYYYKLYVVKDGKEYVTGTKSFKTPPVPTTSSLATPTLSSISNTSNGIRITWKAVSKATGYNIYRKTINGTYAKIASVKTTSYTDTKVNTSTTYTYTVQAYSSSLPSSGYNNKGLTYMYLKPVTVTQVANRNGWITIFYTTVPKAQYEIQRKEIPGGQYKKIGVGANSQNQYYDKTAQPGKVYYYRVIPYNSLNENGVIYRGLSANEKRIIRIATPTLSSVTSKSSKTMTVTWKTVQCDGYEIVYSTKNDFSGSKTVKVAGGSSYWKTISKLSKGTYYVKIRAYSVYNGTTNYSYWSATKSVKIK